MVSLFQTRPYGERLLDDKAVDILYNEMGQTFAPLKTWSKFILTSDEQFESKYGMKADKNVSFITVHSVLICINILVNVFAVLRLER